MWFDGTEAGLSAAWNIYLGNKVIWKIIRPGMWTYEEQGALRLQGAWRFKLFHYSLFYRAHTKDCTVKTLEVFLLKLIICVDECTSQLPKVPTIYHVSPVTGHATYLQPLCTLPAKLTVFWNENILNVCRWLLPQLKITCHMKHMLLNVVL